MQLAVLHKQSAKSRPRLRRMSSPKVLAILIEQETREAAPTLQANFAVLRLPFGSIASRQLSNVTRFSARHRIVHRNVRVYPKKRATSIVGRSVNRVSSILRVLHPRVNTDHLTTGRSKTNIDPSRWCSSAVSRYTSGDIPSQCGEKSVANMIDHLFSRSPEPESDQMPVIFLGLSTSAGRYVGVSRLKTRSACWAQSNWGLAIRSISRKWFVNLRRKQAAHIRL